MEEDLIFKKATLALGGAVLLPRGFEVPVRVSHSTAGPGAGRDSAAFRFGGMRVKKEISFEKGEFELCVREDGSLYLTRGGEEFIDRIEFEPVIFHCPDQAFFTLDPKCSLRCAFCSSPRLPEIDSKNLTDDMIVERIREVRDRVKAVSLTSGVMKKGIAYTAERFVSCIRAIRKEMPDIPIGIEPYAGSEKQVKAYKEAGADEIKINIQAATRSIFAKVCPGLDWDNTIRSLGYAVKYFGKGKVTSNIIYGMGETDPELEKCMEMLASMDVIPTVHSLWYSTFNRESINKAIGTPIPVSPERMIKVAKMQKDVMVRHGLDTRSSHTMCLECGGCDLIPFRDFRSFSRASPRTRTPCSGCRCRVPRTGRT